MDKLCSAMREVSFGQFLEECNKNNNVISIYKLSSKAMTMPIVNKTKALRLLLEDGYFDRDNWKDIFRITVKVPSCVYLFRTRNVGDIRPDILPGMCFFSGMRQENDGYYLVDLLAFLP